MSAGNFIRSSYQARNGTIYPCRIQPETASLTIGSVANDPPAGPIDGSITARMRGSRRRFGVTARKVSLEFTGALPDGYSGDPVDVPVLSPGVFDGYNPGAAGTYLGQAVVLISKTAEQLR